MIRELILIIVIVQYIILCILYTAYTYTLDIYIRNSSGTLYAVKPIYSIYIRILIYVYSSKDVTADT